MRQEVLFIIDEEVIDDEDWKGERRKCTNGFGNPLLFPVSPTFHFPLSLPICTEAY